MTLFESLAEVLTYPGAGQAFQPVLSYDDAIANALAAATLESAEPLARFAESVRGLSIVELQELYIRTFDLNPVCALEIGWHLFGENYDRGIMLVRLRALLDKHGIRESGELPDHLTHALRLLDRMSDEDALDFAAACVVPALHKMRAAIAGNPYEPVIDAILRVLYARFPELPLPVGVPAEKACHSERREEPGWSGGALTEVDDSGATHPPRFLPFDKLRVGMTGRGEHEVNQ